MYGLDDIANARGMHIGHLNVRSMVNKWDLLKAQFSSSNFHILGFSETWLSEALPTMLFELSSEYTFLRNDRNWSENTGMNVKKGGGLGIYIHNGLNFSETSHNNLNCSIRDIEMQWISIKQPHSKLILVGNVYRPPQGNIESFMQVLENVFSNIDTTNTEMYLMGDFNIDWMEIQNVTTKGFKSFMKTMGLRQLIKEPTRCTLDHNSCLDLFFTNSDLIYNVGVESLNISDHSLILLSRRRLPKIRTKCSFLGRSYRRYDKTVFQNNILNSDWTKFDDSPTIDDKWKELENIIRNCIDNMCPLKHFRIKQEKEPWITPQLIELIKDKDHILKRAKRSKNPAIWAEAKRFRNNCTRRLRDARADFIRQNLDNNIGNQKKFWKNIQDVLPIKSQRKGSIKLDDKNTGNPIDEKDTASYINDFFVNIGPNLAKHCNEAWNFQGTPSPDEISDIETDVDEVARLCKAININKASCIENISSEILRDAFLIIPERIARIFNLSFNTGKIPEDWKIAKITPLQKTGDLSDVSNYRPVSLLPLPSKLIETIVHNRIYTHCEINGLLDPRQGGFRPGHSTISSTSFYLNDIYNAMNNNNILLATYIDAMKAFDTVNHKILLDKAKLFGISGMLYKWLENYLSNRFQCTLANNIVSELKLITCGVPQGSVCGPLLFLMYINDIAGVLNHCKVALYADDTVLYIESENVSDAVTLMQNDLNALAKWCNGNKLSINCKKTKYCIYGMRSKIKKSKTEDTILSLNNHILNRVCSYKYLGFILDDHLNFNKHVGEMCNTLSHKLYLLSKIRKYITLEASILIFKTMILPIMEYGDIIYAGTSILNLQKIDRLFYRGLRICTKYNHTVSKEQLCDDGNLDSLNVRRKKHMLLFMHKQTLNDELLKKANVHTRLHNAPVFKTYKPNNEKARLNVLYRGAIAWNELSANERNMEFKEFKAMLLG